MGPGDFRNNEDYRGIITHPQRLPHSVETGSSIGLAGKADGAIDKKILLISRIVLARISSAN